MLTDHPVVATAASGSAAASSASPSRPLQDGPSPGLRVCPETVGEFFREGEAPAEPRRDGSATIVAIRSPAGANPRDPAERTGTVCSACGSAGASPSPPIRQFRGRVSGQAL